MKNLYTFLVLAFTTVSGLFAQAPVNDDCSGALPLTIAANQAALVYTTASTSNATTATYTSTCWSTSYDDDIWYSFVATDTTLVLSIANIATTGGVIGYSLQDAPCGSTELSCGSGNVNVLSGLTVGSTYYLSVFYIGTANTGAFDLGLYVATPLVNDNCSGAIAMTVAANQAACTPTTANTTTATTASYTSNCWSTSYDDDVWYSFTATDSVLMLNISNLSAAAGTVGYSLQGSPCASAEISCGSGSALLSGLTVGNTYYLSVFYSGTTDRGTFDLCIYKLTQPANDTCAGAITIPVATDANSCTPTAATTAMATIGNPLGSCATTAVGDVWYSFVATDSLIALEADLANVGFALFTGSCSALSEVACSATNPYTFSNLTIGTTYYLKAFADSVLNFNFCAYSVPPAPANDDCSGAITVNVASSINACTPTTSNTTSATTATYTSTCWSTSYDDDVWYSFTATSSTVVLNTSNLGVAGGSIGYSLQDSPCVSAEITCGSDSATFTGLTVGNTYYLSMFYSGTTNRGTFDFCLYTVQPPANDDCANAIALTTAASQAACTATTSDLTGSTLATPVASCATTAVGDVWFTFTANSTTQGVAASNMSASLTDIGFAIYSGTCGNLTEVACSNTATSVFTNLTSGTTYYLQAFSSTIGAFDVCVYATNPPPANDNCDGAIVVPVKSTQASCTPTTVNTVDATTANYTSNCWSTSYDDDMWYTFTATDTVLFIDASNLSASPDSLGFSVFEASCTGTEMYCNYLSSTDTISGLTKNTSYYMSIFYIGTTERGTFDFCLYDNNTTGIREFDANTDVRLYPNPAKNEVSVFVNSNAYDRATVQIVDLGGRPVYTVSNLPMSESKKHNIDISKLSKGIYLVEVITNEGKAVRKLTIE
jgi:hypothetical protein